MYFPNLTFSCHFAVITTSSENLSQVPCLLQEYKSCLATRKFDEAEKTNKEIQYLITNEISTTGDELERFADGMLEKADRFEETIPLYFAAACRFKKDGNLRRMSSCVGDGCGAGMHRANKKMITRDATMKEVVKHHVIPLMRDIKNQMLEMTSVSKCMEMSRVLERIALSEKLVDDDEAAEEAMKECRVWRERGEDNFLHLSRTLLDSAS